MATGQMEVVIRHLRRAVPRQDGADRTDGELLTSFIEEKDEAAFEALVRRHGSMVFGVCWRIVRNHHDAEDAFQTTFLVLARKASSVRPRERVANWLHGVALRTAMKAKAMTAKRRGREKQMTVMPEPEAVPQDQWRDLQTLLDQELNGLPENYRLPIVLCDLEGRAIKDAAQQLGWPQGTVAGRLARGRKLLAKRLANRGVVLSAGALAAVVSRNAVSAAVPISLMSTTVKAAAGIAAGQAAVAGVVPAKVVALMEGMLKTMFLTKLKSLISVTMALLAIMAGVGVGLLGYGRAPGQRKEDNKAEVAVVTPAAGQIPTAEKKDRIAKVPQGQPSETDKDKLQGNWQIMSLDLGGMVIKREDKLSEWKDTFGKEMFFKGDRHGQVGYSTSKFTLDETRNPKQITVYADDGKLIYRGIYAIEGDILKMCMNGDGTSVCRPEEFVTKKGASVIITTLKKVSTKK